MPTQNPPYIQLLNNYRRFVGVGKLTSLLSSILSIKAGFKPGIESERNLLRWAFFKRLIRSQSIQPLAIGDHEFRIRYTKPQSGDSRIEVAIRVPFCDSSDTEVFDQVFIRQEYLAALEWFQNICPRQKISTIMDVGANIGCTALFLSTHFPLANIFCLEPEESNYVRLQLNIELNRQKNIRCFRGALSTESGRLKLTRDFRDGKEWGSRFIEDKATRDGSEKNQFADAIDIWGFFEKTGFDQVDLLKMDVEGAEAGLLRNSRFKTFLMEKVQHAVIEVHEEFIKTNEAIEVMKSLGFHTHVTGEFVCGMKRSHAT